MQKTLVALVVLVALGCCDPVDMPLLSNDPTSDHYGYIIGFDVLNAAQIEDIEELTAEATAHGMDVRRIFTTWAAVNPEQGVYELEELTNELRNNFENGYATYVSITTYDSEGIDDVPERFHLGDGSLLLNTRWTDPELIQEYLDTLAQVIPLCEQYRGFAISFSNEAQFPLEDIGDSQVTDDFVEFTRAAREYVNSISDSVAATSTLANYQLDGTFCQGIIDASDIVTLNLYGTVPGSTSSWREDLEIAETLIDSKPLILQEMGLSTDLDGSSEQLQADYITTTFDYLISSSQSRVYFWFLLHDPSDGFLEFNRNALEGFPQDFIDETIASLAGLGMCDLEDDGCPVKLGWQAFLDGQERINGIVATESESTFTTADTISFSSVASTPPTSFSTSTSVSTSTSFSDSSSDSSTFSGSNESSSSSAGILSGISTVVLLIISITITL